MSTAHEIALSSDAPHFSQEQLLFGRHYTIEFEWIEREAYWVLHLYDHQEQAIALGVKVTTGWPIIIDDNLNLVFSFMAKTSNTELNVKTLQSGFVLVAYELV